MIVAISLIVVSCGAQNTKSSNDFVIGAQMMTVMDIDSNQRNIATRICYSYQSKNSNFNSSDYLGTKFNFSVNNKDCSGKNFTESIAAILTKQTIGFTFNATNATQFNTFVQTNISGYLSQVCSKISSNQPISNTIDFNGQTVQLNFFHDTLDGYRLSYFHKDSSNVYVINSAEIFRVRTQINYNAGTILGMDEGYTSQSICSNNPSQINQMDQKFISHN